LQGGVDGSSKEVAVTTGQKTVSPQATVQDRGYKRSRERIIDDVAAALTRAPGTGAGGITVEVTDDRDVILGGEVGDEAEQRVAGELAARVVGVREVRNEIRVRGAQQPLTTRRAAP